MKLHPSPNANEDDVVHATTEQQPAPATCSSSACEEDDEPDMLESGAMPSRSDSEHSNLSSEYPEDEHHPDRLDSTASQDVDDEIIQQVRLDPGLASSRPLRRLIGLPEFSLPTRRSAPGARATHHASSQPPADAATNQASALDWVRQQVFAAQRTGAIIQLELPPSLQNIGEGAFMRGNWLGKIDLLECVQLKHIQAYTFKDCKNLKIVNLPPNLERIDGSAFENTAVVSFACPASLKHIGPTILRGSLVETIDLSRCTVASFSLDPSNFAGCEALRQLRLPPRRRMSFS